MIEPSYEEVRYQLQQTREALKSREQRLRELGVDDWVPLPAEEQPAVIKTCGHIKEDGWSCDSPAVTDRDLCHFHLGSRGRRLKMARARSRGERWLLQVPPLENLYSLQVGLMQVQDAMTNGQLDRRLGGVILYGLQQAADDLRLARKVWEDSDRFDNVGKVTWPGFEREHGLPKGFDVNTPPDEAFPQPAASPAAMEARGEDLVTEDDIELEDLAAQDPEACRRRAKQLSRKYRRRLHHDEEKLARACRILEAARRNEEAGRKAPDKVTADARPIDSAAGAGAADPGASAIGEAARKSPQVEACKKGQPVEGAS